MDDMFLQTGVQQLLNFITHIICQNSPSTATWLKQLAQNILLGSLLHDFYKSKMNQNIWNYAHKLKKNLKIYENRINELKRLNEETKMKTYNIKINDDEKSNYYLYTSV